MSASDGDDLAPLVADLVRTLRDLEAEFEPRTRSGLPRPPSPSELVRFTSDVGIPAVILLLRTNIEALKLLQRALRMADGRSPAGEATALEARNRAERLSRRTLSRLDGALADLQNAVEGRPEDADARELLDEARRLRAEVESKLEARAKSEGHGGGDDGEEDEPLEGSDPFEDEGAEVPVDVDAELQSIKDAVQGENGDGSADGPATGDGTREGDAADDSDGPGESDATDGGRDASGDGGEPSGNDRDATDDADDRGPE